MWKKFPIIFKVIIVRVLIGFKISKWMCFVN